MSILCKLGLHGRKWMDTNGRTSILRCGRPGCHWVNDKQAAAKLEFERAVARHAVPTYDWRPHH